MNEPETPAEQRRRAAAAEQAARRARLEAERAARREARRIRDAEPVRVARKHDGLVRVAHWVHVPLLVGLIVSGLAIYWAAPVFHHAPTPGNPRGDWLVDIGRTLAAWFGDSGDTGHWLYDRASLGPFQ